MNTIELESRHTSGVYGKRDVAIVRGEGATVWDENGRSYLDFVAGISVANIGHAHPKLVAAISEQAKTLLTCPEMFYNDQRAQLSAQLAAIMPGDLDRVFLCNSGTEATEGAIKFARLATGKTDVVATMRGFHGRTMGALSATHNPKYRKPFGPLVPGFTHVPYGKLDKMEAAISEQTAAIIIEPVQGEGGVRPGNFDYLRAVRQLCDDHGILLIMDEVQTGFGRTGRWFGCEHAGVVPDLMAMGKAIAGGVPMGAIGVGPKVTGLKPGMHGSTFGGNPLACAAALATLDIFEEEQLLAKSNELGAYFKERLEEINSPLIREVRGLGLMIGMELRIRAREVVVRLMERGILTLTASPNVLRMLPPLVVSREELDRVVEAIRDVLSELGQG
ncbi:MAG: acetylornithine transaminase [Chloroflexota bacterium]